MFLLLETGAILLLVNHNAFQQSVAFRVGTVVSAWGHGLTAGVSRYFGLAGENELLAEQNTVLMNENEMLRMRLAAVDSSGAGAGAAGVADIRYIKARVVHNSVYKTRNYVIIDRGSDDGVAADMGVMCAAGVAGVVERVSANYAVVLPLINPDMRVSAKVASSGQLGSIIWKGYDPGHVQMDEVPAHSPVAQGDTVVTSGYSAIFPEGVMIGVVERAVLPENGRFWRIEVRTAVDFSRLDYVTVSAYRHQREFLELENGL